MNATVAPRCLCSHSGWRHIAGRYRCTAPACGCGSYRVKEAPREAFEAPMAGLCPICKDPINVGERVAFYRDASGVMDVAHDGCIESGISQ